MATDPTLERIGDELQAVLVTLDPADAPLDQLATLLHGFGRIGRLADAGVALVAGRVADSHERGRVAGTGELGRLLGMGRGEAERVVGTADQLATHPEFRAAAVGGELSRAKAGLLAEGIAADSASEAGLLELARRQDLRGLRREVERVKAAAGDPARDRERAHAERSMSTFTRNGEWHMHAHGPIAEGAEIEACLQPFRDRALDEHRKAGRKETFGAAGFDGLLAMARAATGVGSSRDLKKRRWQAVIRVDADAIRRRRTTGSEVCEIPGVGPIDVATAIDLLGEATVRALVTNGVDVLSVARVDRYRPPELDVAVMEAAGFECANRACSNTGYLEVDHDDEFCRTHDTSYRNLHVLCGSCHDLKTIHGYQIRPHADGGIEFIPPKRGPTHDPYAGARQ